MRGDSGFFQQHYFAYSRRRPRCKLNRASLGYIDINLSCLGASWQDALISILFVHGPGCEHYLGDDAPGPRFLSLSSCTASGKSAGTALRRCAAPNRSDKRPVLANDVSEPSETIRYGGSGLTTCHGSDHVDGRSEALASPPPGQDHGRPSGRSQPSDDADGKGTKVAGTRRSSLEEYPHGSRGTSVRWRLRPPPEQFTRTLLNIPRGRDHLVASFEVASPEVVCLSRRWVFRRTFQMQIVARSTPPLLSRGLRAPGFSRSATFPMTRETEPVDRYALERQDS